VQSKNITYQSSKIHYRITGKGKPFLLIHGFGEDGNIWDKQVEFLKDHFQLIVPDLPGSGKSALIEDMSMEGMAEVVKEIMNNELQEGVIMAGHSMGGYITLAFAEKYPQLLSSFALVHSSAFADSEEKKANRLKSIEFVKKNGAYEFLKASIRGLFSEQWSRDHENEIDELVEKSKHFSDEAIIQYYRAMIARPDRTQVLRSFPGPVSFIMGVHDNAVPFQQSLQQCYLPSRSHVHILRNSAHMGMWEETSKVNTALHDLK
jgi:pimeloyl-ACP methyl ester carboxylesterase